MCEGLITSFDSSIAADEIPTSSFNDYQRPVLNTIHAVWFLMGTVLHFSICLVAEPVSPEVARHFI